ncbi:MAG: sigma-70 family RNA polymerase sigma factor [Phycisphaerales bacterium]|nr:sigma-70 family RNA polymerase sigma factor [Phycisphaerales bacterium]
MGQMTVFSSNSHGRTSSSLLLRLRQDGQAREVAWHEFYELYSPIISGFARRMGAQGEIVDDLVQEVMRAFFAASPEFSYDPARGRFRGYLKTCVTRKLSEMRAKIRPESGGLDASRVVAPESADHSADAHWDDVWETEKLQRALAIVRERYAVNPERQRTFRAFEMCSLLDLSTDEVARQLGISGESVRAAKSRVSKSLRQAFDDLDDVLG